jgi:hypothetical protein
MSVPPLGLETVLVPLDLRCPLRHWGHEMRELLDLAVPVEGVAVSRERCAPPGIGAGSELPAGVDEDLMAEHLLTVHVGPLAILTLHLGVEPQVPVSVGVQRP